MQYSGRPGTSRSQSRFNPITGEEMPYGQTPRQGTVAEPTRARPGQDLDQSRYYSDVRPDTRPSNIPKLNLSRLGGADDPSSYKVVVDRNPQPRTPHTAVSWGTPHSTHNDFVYKDLQKSQPAAVASLNLGDGQSARAPAPLKPAPVVKIGEAQAQLERLALKTERQAYHNQGAEDEEDEQLDALQRSWTQAPYGKEALRRISDKEELEEQKRKSKMLETVLIDQLNRPVMSDPLQTSSQSSSRQTPSYQPGMKRGMLRALHDSKVKTDGTGTENLLSRRVRFQARVLTSCGRDAIRELTGFFFATDNSLTVYEFRQFGKTSKAMPFIKRGCYRHVVGKRSGEAYTLADIKQGVDMIFDTVDQPMPDSLKEDSIIVLRIAELDQDAKMEILMEGVGYAEREKTWTRLHMPKSAEEFNAQALLENVHALVKRQISRRGVRVYTGLGRLLRACVKQAGDKKLNKYELEKALVDFHIDIPQEKVDDLWELYDVDNTSFLPYDVFMRAFLGEMNETRKFYVLKAFIKLDAGKTGIVALSDMRMFYNVRKHPKVKSGESTEDEVLETFLSSFKDTAEKGRVTYKEFEEYYEGLSVCVDDDQDFINIIKNTWNI